MIMNHESNVAFVDSHPERVCSNYRLKLPAHESVLGARTLRFSHSPVIGLNIQARHLEFGADLLDALASRGVDDARASRGLDHVLQRREFFFLGCYVNDSHRKIRAIESRHQKPRIDETELLDDICSDALCRGCRQRKDFRAAQPSGGFFELEIIRSEVMSPMRYAMRFVDREQAHVDLRD